MDPIICQSDVRIVLNTIQDFLRKGGIIKDLYVLEVDDSQVVLLLHDDLINENSAKIWWSGYSEGMKAALQ